MILSSCPSVLALKALTSSRSCSWLWIIGSKQWSSLFDNTEDEDSSIDSIGNSLEWHFLQRKLWMYISPSSKRERGMCDERKKSLASEKTERKRV